MGNVSDESCRENKKKHFRFRNLFHIARLRDKVEKYCKAGQANISQYCVYALHAGYLRLKTHNHNMVIRIEFPQQQWLYERASILHVHCLPCYLFVPSDDLSLTATTTIFLSFFLLLLLRLFYVFPLLFLILYYFSRLKKYRNSTDIFPEHVGW
jgi:hypothetical protein